MKNRLVNTLMGRGGVLIDDATERIIEAVNFFQYHIDPAAWKSNIRHKSARDTTTSELQLLP